MPRSLSTQKVLQSSVERSDARDNHHEESEQSGCEENGAPRSLPEDQMSCLPSWLRGAVERRSRGLYVQPLQTSVCYWEHVSSSLTHSRDSLSCLNPIGPTLGKIRALESSPCDM